MPEEALIISSQALAGLWATGQRTYEGRDIIRKIHIRGCAGACAYCLERIGWLEWERELEARDEMPPYHNNCRCYAVVVEYALAPS